jgi:hypothetical protein
MISLNFKANATLKKKSFFEERKRRHSETMEMLLDKKTVSESICKEPIARKVTNKKSEKTR